MIDLKNQLNYQTLVRDDKAGLEPFVAGIVSPYNPKISDFKSELSWFYVAHKNTDRGSRGAEPAGFAPGACELDKDCRSMSLDVQPSLDSTQLIVNVMAKIKTLAKWYSNSANSTEWSSLWDGNVTLMDKMMSSVSQRLPRSWQGSIAEVFLSRPPLCEKNSAGPAVDTRGGGMRLEREKDKESLIKEHINNILIHTNTNTEKAIVFNCFQPHIL